jgi:hypothetical protein
MAGISGTELLALQKSSARRRDTRAESARATAMAIIDAGVEYTALQQTINGHGLPEGATQHGLAVRDHSARGRGRPDSSRLATTPG